jgi:Uroporphyrinogen decarboxylase (URO-D)
MEKTPKSEIEKMLANQEPSRFVYSPNYWQWFKHQKDHKLLPDEIKHCQTSLDLYNYLGVDVFSRNIYSDPETYWFGGLCDEIIDDFKIVEKKSFAGKDKVTEKEYVSSIGSLKEKLTYLFNDSTLVQNKFLVTDYDKEFDLFKHFVANRRWQFNKQKYKDACDLLGDKGVVIAGEFFSPLKMLHFVMGPVNTVYFLMEHSEKAELLLELHEKSQLDCIKQCVENGVKVVMAMDNLDTMFHPPDYVKDYSSSFYTKASKICHANDARFFVHACGQQKDNLKLLSSYGVDGLEGVAAPPLGDVTYNEACLDTRDGFIITGGISAMETRDLKTREEIFHYIEDLFKRMVPNKDRFILSSSCNTAIDTSWETIKHFRDAWLKYRDIK